MNILLGILAFFAAPFCAARKRTTRRRHTDRRTPLVITGQGDYRRVTYGE